MKSTMDGYSSENDTRNSETVISQDKSSNWDSNNTTDNEEIYLTPNSVASTASCSRGYSNGGNVSASNRYVSQVYISASLSHRSRRHIRDSREYDQMPTVTRSFLEVGEA